MKKIYVHIAALLLCSIIASFQLLSQSIDTIDQQNEYRNEPESHTIWLGVGYSTGIDRTEKVLGIQQYMLTVGGFARRSRWLQFHGSYVHTPLLTTSDPEYSIEHGLSMVELGMDLKFYTPSAYSFLGHYFSGGIGAVFAYWHYSSNIPDDELAQAFDAVWGVDLHVGTGFNLGKLWPLNVNLDFTPGIILWVSDSDKGFSNTILPVYYYCKVGITLNYSIAKW